MNTPKVFVIDVDGVMTDGRFYYSAEGKVLKLFGADDADGLSLLNPFIDIRFISGDKRGFPITKKRVFDDMHYPVDLVSTVNRIHWINERYDPAQVIYMGDGLLDPLVFRQVFYSIAPINALPITRRCASHVTERAGGDRAVAEACLHILDKFFEGYNPEKPLPAVTRQFGEWAV